MKSFNQSYSNNEITVYFKPRLCNHAAVCLRELSKVFDLYNEPWINIKGASAKEIADCIDKCPTGALSYEWKDNKNKLMKDSKEILVTIAKSGPLTIHSDCKIVDENGKEHITKNKVAICMCGLSEKHPFCDGKHTSLSK